MLMTTKQWISRVLLNHRKSFNTRPSLDPYIKIQFRNLINQSPFNSFILFPKRFDTIYDHPYPPPFLIISNPSTHINVSQVIISSFHLTQSPQENSFKFRRKRTLKPFSGFEHKTIPCHSNPCLHAIRTAQWAFTRTHSWRALKARMCVPLGEIRIPLWDVLEIVCRHSIGEVICN